LPHGTRFSIARSVTLPWGTGLVWKYESASSANRPSSADTSTENTTVN